MHWFGLTDGHFWIQADEHKLFEYHQASRSHSGVPQYCDYQVARLYEDIIGLVPHALEPVPEGLQQYITLNEERPWNHFWHKWCNAIEGIDVPKADTDLLGLAGRWLGHRTLDSMYLSPPTNIIIWSTPEVVHIQWDNRGLLLQGRPAWAASFGNFTMPRDAFIEEVRSFHERLTAQMAYRVLRVASGALAPSIRVHLDGLYSAQQFQSQPIERTLRPIEPPTDWSEVIQAVRRLESI